MNIRKTTKAELIEKLQLANSDQAKLRQDNEMDSKELMAAYKDMFVLKKHIASLEAMIKDLQKALKDAAEQHRGDLIDVRYVLSAQARIMSLPKPFVPFYDGTEVPPIPTLPSEEL